MNKRTLKKVLEEHKARSLVDFYREALKHYIKEHISSKQIMKKLVDYYNTYAEAVWDGKLSKITLKDNYYYASIYDKNYKELTISRLLLTLNKSTKFSMFLYTERDSLSKELADYMEVADKVTIAYLSDKYSANKRTM